ncbi:L10-interacting MYB domain-containing protein-like isoform X2 [Wolffia australiana]
MLPSEFMALTEMHLASQQLGSAYRFEDIGDGQRRLSWTFEKRGEIMEWRWDCELCGDKKRATIEFLDSLLDMHIPLARLSERANGSISPLAAKDPELKIRQRLKNERVKAVWDDKKHTAFVRICLEQMRAGNRPHKTLNKLGYMNLAREFHKHTGFFYHKDQLKNHWDSTRRDWQAWTALKNQPGLGWDCSKGTFSQTEDWWACFAKMFPGSEKFAHRPLEHQEELDLLFGGGSGQSSSDATTRDSQSAQTPESHAEDEVNFCLTAAAIAGTTEESAETIERPEKRRCKAGGTAAGWEACMKQVYDILLGGSKLLGSDTVDDQVPIPQAMALLNTTHAIERNSEEWLFAVSKLRNESIRQLFLALGDAESRAAWIKREYRLSLPMGN